VSQPDLAPKSNQRPKPVPHVQQGVSQYAWSQVRHPYGLQGEQAGQDHHFGENQKNERVSCMRMHAGFRDPAGSRGSCMVHALMRIRIPGSRIPSNISIIYCSAKFTTAVLQVHASRSRTRILGFVHKSHARAYLPCSWEQLADLWTKRKYDKFGIFCRIISLALAQKLFSNRYR